MKFEQWLKTECRSNDLKISERTIEPNSFISKTWSIENNKGLTIDVSQNSDGELSMIDTDRYRFSNLTIADFSQEFMLQVLADLLHGNYQVHKTKFLKRSFLEFHDKATSRTVVSKSRK